MLQADSSNAHWLIGVGVTIGLAGLAGLISYVGMMIKADNLKSTNGVMEKLDKNKGEIRTDIAEVSKKAEQVKNELGEKLEDLKDDFNAKHLENSNTLVAHIAKDDVRDESNSRTFRRMDDNLNEIRKKIG